MPIGYIGMSVFPGWGHIDRLAVVRGKQGSGYGRALTQLGLGACGASARPESA